jgi:hypothetical protein
MNREELLKIVAAGVLALVAFTVGKNSTQPTCTVEGKNQVCKSEWYACKGMLNRPLICKRRNDD